MSVYKLYGAGSGGTENSIASLDVQFDGTIVAIHGSMQMDLDADGEAVNYEVSFLSSNTVAVNDSRGSLMIMNGITSAATGLGSRQSSVSGLSIPVAAGERIHMHVTSTAGVGSTAHFYLYVNDDAPAALRRRR